MNHLLLQVDHPPLPLLDFPGWQFHDSLSGLLRETILDSVFNTIQYLPFWIQSNIQLANTNFQLIPSQSAESVVDLSFRPSLRSDLMCHQVTQSQQVKMKQKNRKKTEKHFSVRARSQGKTEDRLPVAGFGAALWPNHLLLSQVRLLVQSAAGYTRETL